MPSGGSSIIASGGIVEARGCRFDSTVTALSDVGAAVSWDCYWITYAISSSGGVGITHKLYDCEVTSSLSVGTLASIVAKGIVMGLQGSNSVTISGSDGGTNKAVLVGTFEGTNLTITSTAASPIVVNNVGAVGGGITCSTTTSQVSVSGDWGECTFSNATAVRRFSGSAASMDFTGPGMLDLQNTSSGFGDHVKLRGDGIQATIHEATGRLECISLTNSGVWTVIPSGTGSSVTLDASSHNNVFIVDGKHGATFGGITDSGTHNLIITEDGFFVGGVLIDLAHLRSRIIQTPPPDDAEPGEEGPPGIRGKRGLTGLTGSTGSTGATGAKGKRGENAPPPDDPEEGEPGPPGLRGKRGAAGATGATGPPGPAGGGSAKFGRQTPPPEDDPAVGFLDSPFGDDDKHSPTPSAKQLVPRGAIMMWGGAAAPLGWMLCQGGTLSRAEPLFGIIGTTYGVGNGTTTFNVPDFQERFPLGKGGTHALGASQTGQSHSHGVTGLTTSLTSTATTRTVDVAIAAGSFTQPSLGAITQATYNTPTHAVPHLSLGVDDFTGNGAGSGFAKIHVITTSNVISERGVATANWTATTKATGTQTADSTVRAAGTDIGGQTGVGSIAAAACTLTGNLTIGALTGGSFTLGAITQPTFALTNGAGTVGGTLDNNTTTPLDPFVTVNYIIKL